MYAARLSSHLYPPNCPGMKSQIAEATDNGLAERGVKITTSDSYDGLQAPALDRVKGCATLEARDRCP